MTPIPLQPNMPMPTDYSGDPVPPKQYYICPHCKEQSPLTKEWVDLTQQELDELDEQSPSLHEFVQNLMSKLKEKNNA